MMSRFARISGAMLCCTGIIGFCGPIPANAAPVVVPIVPPATPAPAAKSVPKLKPHQVVVENDVTRAYRYRTRILTDNPNCQRYATGSDAVFYNDKINDEAKAVQIEKIGLEAAASGCLGP